MAKTDSNYLQEKVSKVQKQPSGNGIVYSIFCWPSSVSHVAHGVTNCNHLNIAADHDHSAGRLTYATHTLVICVYPTPKKSRDL